METLASAGVLCLDEAAMVQEMDHEQERMGGNKWHRLGKVR